MNEYEEIRRKLEEAKRPKIVEEPEEDKIGFLME